MQPDRPVYYHATKTIENALSILSGCNARTVPAFGTIVGCRQLKKNNLRSGATILWRHRELVARHWDYIGMVLWTGGQNPKHSILDSQPRARLFSFEYTQLLTEGKDLEAEVVAGTEECAEAGEEVDAKRNHESGFIAWESTPPPALIA